MKLVFLFVIAGFLSANAYSARQDVTGEVGKVRYHIDEGALAPTWNKSIWFQLNDASKSFCDRNRVSIPPGNEVAVSMLLAAKMGSKRVEITIDDSKVYPNGHTYCKLQYISIL